MRNPPLLVAWTVCVPAALAQQPVSYESLPGSTLLQELCLPPCACPYNSHSGPLTLRFTLVQTGQDPLFTHYALESITGSALVNGQTVTVVGSGLYDRGGEFAVTHRLRMDLTVGPLQVIESFDSGTVGADPQHPFPEISIESTTGIVGCRRDTITLLAAPSPGACYPNCDGSTAPPILNVLDFNCFLNRFSAGDPYANCDGSTSPPVLNVLDFNCFLNSFSAGCP
jgi:hypothetical protein